MRPRKHRTTIYREVEIDVDLVRDDDGTWQIDGSYTNRKPIELTDEEERKAISDTEEDTGPDPDAAHDARGDL